MINPMTDPTLSIHRIKDHVFTINIADKLFIKRTTCIWKFYHSNLQPEMNKNNMKIKWHNYKKIKKRNLQSNPPNY